MVEIGYSVDPDYRRRGFANAIVRASISPDNVASLAMIAGFGFTQVGDQWDEEDGLELLFELATHTKE